MLDRERGFEESEEPQLSISGVVRALDRRRGLVAGVSALLLVPAVLFPLSLPDIYSAQATLEILTPPEVTELGPDFMTVRQGTGRRREPLGPVISLAESDTVLGRVVDQLPSPDEEASFLDLVLALMGVRPNSDSYTAAQIRRTRVEALRRRLTFEDGGDGTVLIVSSEGVDPASAAWLVNAVADAVVSYSREERKGASKAALTWLNTQIYDLREKIDRQTQALKDLVQRTGIRPPTLTDGGSVGNMQERAVLEEELREASIDLLAAEQRLAELGPLFDPARESSRAFDGTDALLTEYLEARAQLARARTAYTAVHPEVRRLEKLVASLAARLGPGRLADLRDPTPAEINEYGSLSAERSRLQARVQVLKEALAARADPDGTRSAALDQYQQRRREIDISLSMIAVLLERRNSTLLTAANDVLTTRIRDHAVPAIEPSGPDRVRLWVLGCAAALMGGLGAAVLREKLDQTIRDPEQASQILDVPVLGMIPKVIDGTPAEHQSQGPPSDLSSESYRNLRTAIKFARRSSGPSALLVTSATVREGKTTTSCNLATTFAQAGHRVLLVDADLRRPRVHEVFELPREPGLAELLRGEMSFEEGLEHRIGSNLEVLTAGRPPENPSELLGSPEFAKLLTAMKSRYELVVIDSAVLLGVSDSYLLSTQADATLLVHRPGSIERAALAEIRDRLIRARVPIMGVVFNHVDRADRHFYPSYMDSPYVTRSKAREDDTAGRRKTGAAL